MQQPLTFLGAVKDSSKLPQWFNEHRTSVLIWSGFSAFLFFVMIFISDRDFSFLLTLSSMISLMSFAMMLVKIELTRSVSGVSGRMMTCYMFVMFSRLISIVFWEGYLPWDSTGDWFYQMCEGITLCLCGLTLYNTTVKYKGTAEVDSDYLNPLFLIVPSFILAIILHPNLNNNFMGDTFWAFALYLEAVAGLPQLVLFHRESKVEPFTSHFLAAQCLAKICSFIFWLMTATELNGASGTIPGIWVVIMQAVQLLIMADFLYQYVVCLSRGVSVQFLLKEKV